MRRVRATPSASGALPFAPSSRLVRAPYRTAPGARSRVGAIDARVYPYSAVGLLAPSYCTTTLVGPHTALTAAHCVWDRGAGTLRGGYPTGAPTHVTAAYFGLSGACDAAVYIAREPILHVSIPDAYTDPRAPNAANFDFAFLDFANEAPGSVVGWYGVGAPIVGPIYIAGFPADEDTASLWERGPGEAGASFGGSLPDVFTHDLDISPGDSGACVFTWVQASPELGWRVCVGLQIARIDAGPALARAWGADMRVLAAQREH